MADDVDLGRRSFLRGRRRAAPTAIRPPWSRLDLFTALCTRCDACVDACPEGILRAADGGFPEVDFAAGECSFCGVCADACPRPVFDRSSPAPWTLQAAIGPSCLAVNRVFCRSCRDTCPERAIGFALSLGGIARPRVHRNACTGCGACVSACPVGAVTVGTQSEGADAA